MNDSVSGPWVARIEPQIAAIAKQVINKVEATIPQELDRSHIYARLVTIFMEACQGEMVDVLQRTLKETSSKRGGK